jgi:cellulose synthase/poly-beta-1,6-N-acetylglucosamine synthase-like glycosyltransferase
LQSALKKATGDYIAVFDADFQPQPDFLLQTTPHFLDRSRLGMIQTRWGHLNDGDTTLTGAQAIAIDKHFAMEQTVRHRANLFPKFNGSAGVWRRACLEDAGGWEADTVCEDLCLSTRAVLNGWEFRFLNDVVAPAELPATISAYKNQQSRWAKGSTQCLFKFGPAILTSRQHSLTARLYAVLAMAGYTTHLLLLVLLLVQVPLVYLNQPLPSGLFIFGLAGIGQPLLFILGQQTLYSDWRRRLLRFPSMLLIAVGLAPSNARAMFQIALTNNHPFIRTPKGFRSNADKQTAFQYQLPFDWIVLIELLLAAYSAVGLFLCLLNQNIGPLFFFLTCTLGFGYVAWMTIKERF